MATESLYRDIDIDFSPHQFLSGLGRKWYIFAAVFTLFSALGVAAYFSQEDVYTSEAKILVKTDKTSSLSGLNEPGLEGLGDIKSLGKTSDPVITEAEILRSNPLAQSTIQELGLKDDEGEILRIEDFHKILRVKEVPDTDMLSIAYRSEDAVESANVVNQLVSLYMERNVRRNREEASNARVFLEQQLPKSELRVREIEAELRAFREKHQVLALEQQTTALVEDIDDIDDQIQAATIEKAEVSQQISTLQSKLGMNSQSASEATTLSTSAVMQQLLTALQDVQRQLDEERSRYQEQHPIIQALRDQENALQSRLQLYSQQISPGMTNISLETLQLSALDQRLTADLVQLEVENTRLQSRLDGLSGVKQAQASRSQQIPYLEQLQRELNRRLEAAQGTYTSLLQRLQEIQIAESKSIGNIEVIAEATLPDKPDSTGKKLLLLGGLTLGVLGGTAAALFADLLDDSIKTAEEASTLLGYSLLGIIPAGNEAQQRARLQPFGADSSSAEQALVIAGAYSNLQASVRLLSVRQEPKTLMFTSATSREGASGVVANLAASMAESGAKVLIIDANTEYPVQTQIWQCKEANDLWDLLSSRTSLRDSIQDITPSLSLLPMASGKRRSLSMLDFKKIESIMGELQKQYDFILLDAPSLARSVDASVLGTFVDGIVVVVQPQLATKKDILQMKRRLSHASRHVLGIVSHEQKVGANEQVVSIYPAAAHHPIFIQ